ncbi:MAG: Gingipain R1 [Calditrichaeota bacterium]|nr:Gingipain R1 [Calditrichota bacterium]
MKRKAWVVSAAAMLLLVTGAAPGKQVTSFTLPREKAAEPAFGVVRETPRKTVLQWSAAELVRIEDEQERASYEVPGPRAVESEATYPVHGGLVRLPWGSGATLAVAGGNFHRINEDGTFAEDAVMADAGLYAEDFASLGSPGIFRDLTVVPLTVEPVRAGADGSVWVASDLEMEVIPGGELDDMPEPPERPISRAFLPLYESMLLNEIDDLGQRRAATKGSYLIITANVYYGTLQTSGFLEWKRQKGYNVVVESYDSNQGVLSYGELTSIVQDAYETLDPPLEYVLLVGDQNRGGNAAIPADLINNPLYPSENDVTDWPLAYLEGEDYFPEVFIGRLTVENPVEAYKAANRAVVYEQNGGDIGENDPYWSSAALVAANWSEGGLQPLTPVAITQWVEERMREDWGFPTTHELYWTQGGEQATAQDIRIAIDSGVQYVTYRGWGNAEGWEEPEFSISDIEELDNTFKLPVLTSFVCNTGDFGNDIYPKCFAEHWLTAGSANNPTGAVVVVAPSDLHTNTRYNNALIAGYYWGLFEDNLTNISAALQRAKYELYLGFPTERSPGEPVEFYSHVYHVLGDPELTIWRGWPEQMTVDAPEEITVGQGHVSTSVQDGNSPLSYAYVTVMQDGTVLGGGYPDESGVAAFPIDDAVEGEVTVTVTAPDYLPQWITVPVVQEQIFVGVEDWTVGGDGLVTRGETVNLTVTLVNGGTQPAGDVTATLSFPDDGIVDVTSAEASFGTISAGGTADNAGSPFQFELIDWVWDGRLLEFDLEISSGGNTFTGKIWTPVGAGMIEYVTYENVGPTPFEPGETATLRFKFTNNGSVDAENMDVTLSSYDEAVTAIEGEASGVTVPVGGEAWVGPFDITISGDTYRGRQVILRASFAGDYSFGTEYMTVALEGAQSSDPLGPDAYGYFAYDDTDTNWPENAPAYQWWNLDEDPAVDEAFELADDANAAIALPFDVQYYGETYPAGDTLTISSNGWVGFGVEQEEEYTVNLFRNWHLPSVIGPHAMIAPFWDDLGPPFGSDFMHVYYKHDADNGRILIEWSDAISRFSDEVAYPAYFTLVIYDPDQMLTETGDSVIEVHYDEVENIDERNNFATVGVEKPDRTTGLEYTYASIYPDAAAPLAASRAIRFTTNAPDDLSEIETGPGEAVLPGDFILYPAQPNPFNAATVISFDLPETGDVRLSVYNLLGQEIARLLDRRMTAGHKEVVWQVNGERSKLSSGMLLVRLEANGEVLWGKMMYVK